MRYRYLDDFRRGISVFAIFCYGIAVLGTPQCPPLFCIVQLQCRGRVQSARHTRGKKGSSRFPSSRFSPHPFGYDRSTILISEKLTIQIVYCKR